MNEKLRKRLVFATLPAALIWAVFNYPAKQNAGPAGLAQDPSLQTIAPATVPPESKSRSADIEFMQDQPWGEDPFRSLPRRTTAKSRGSTSLAWTLGGIIYSNQAPVAFINKRMVRVGDRIGDAEVVAIDKKTVTLKHQGRLIKLKLNKG